MSTSPDPSPPRGESRWPVFVILAIAVGLPFLMPEHFLPGPVWLVPAIIVSFMVAMAATDPGLIDRRSIAAHRVRIGLVVVVVGSAAWAATVLVVDLVTGAETISGSAQSLFKAAGVTWLGLMISFSFLYWELDYGGPGARANKERTHADLAFPQELSPEVCPPGWQPAFYDYLYLALTNGMAFSPTDCMPLAHWAKLAMGVQSLTSFLLFGLVVARAVNVMA